MGHSGIGVSHTQVTVGLVGVDSFVHRVIDLARAVDHPSLRLLPASYADEGAAASAVVKVREQVDSLLFAGPLPYDHALAEGEIGRPSVVVPQGGPALHAALIRALTADSSGESRDAHQSAGANTVRMDPARLSVDSVSEAELREAYEEVDLNPDRVHVLPYSASLQATDFVEFHADRFRSGKTTGAISTVPSTVQTLRSMDVPVLRMVPSTLTVRQALSNAILAGSGSRFEEARLAVILAQLPQRTLPAQGNAGQYWFQELRLSLHRELLVEARRLDAIVVDAGPRGFLLLSTVGALRSLTDELTTAPFVGRISDTLGMEIAVGIGIGNTAIEAETYAYRAADETSEHLSEAAVVGPSGVRLRLPGRGGPPAQAQAHDSKDLATVNTLIDKLSADGQDRYVIDAERAAQILEVTLRTARRTLQNLVDAGLAWPVPPSRTKKAGRPPLTFQLLSERVPSRPDRQANTAHR